VLIFPVKQNWLIIFEIIEMANYSKKAQEKIADVMQEFKEGTLESGKNGQGGKVKSREQAIAIGISEAKKSGLKVPKEKSK